MDGKTFDKISQELCYCSASRSIDLEQRVNLYVNLIFLVNDETSVEYSWIVCPVEKAE